MAMTIQEVKEMLDVLKKCKKSILSGEAASYRWIKKRHISVAL